MLRTKPQLIKSDVVLLLYILLQLYGSNGVPFNGAAGD